MERPRPIEDLRAHGHEVLTELRELALPHAEASNGLFVPLDVNPDIYEAQSLLTYKVSGKPQGPGMAELVATGVEPRFPELTHKLEELEQKYGEVSRLGEHLKQGQNIILVTNHGDIKDIAYTLAAYYAKLKQHGYENFHSSLVMSKIISFLGINLGEDADPATNILKTICDTQYFSFPRTKSIRESKIASRVVDTYNEGARFAMERQLSEGSNLFAMAASGTKDKPLSDDPQTLQLTTIGHGTAKLMMQKDSLVVPVAIWVDDKKILFEPCDIPRSVQTEDEAHAVMETIANQLNKMPIDKQFMYSPN
jgi:hypothetical protein